jgi:MoaA/NifB/PqqE/SkfB family radical SAM enzyme
VTQGSLFPIFVGYLCNNYCVLCNQGRLREQEPDNLPVPAQLLQVPSGSSVAFQGGEPTLHEALPSWVRLARERGASRVLVQTNARRLAYVSYATELKRAGVTALDVSLFGSTAAIHDYHTSVEGSFSQTVRALVVAQQAGLEVAVSVVLTRSNYRHWAEIIRLLHLKKIKHVHGSWVQPKGQGLRFYERLHVPKPMRLPYWKQGLELARTLNMEVVVSDQDHPLPAEQQRFAGMGPAEEAEESTGSMSKSKLHLPVHL